MAKSTELTVQESRELLLSPVYQATKTFEMQQRMAQMYVTSTIVPQSYRGNVGNCVIAIDMAQRMGANPLMVMQNLYIVKGNPAWSSKFLISCINTSGRFTPLRYQFKGTKGTEGYACRAYAYEKSDKEHKEPLTGVWITMEMANKEGWTKKEGSKWLTMPDQMLVYRAAAFWARIYAPEISMGFMTKEEVEDIGYAEIVEPEIITAAGGDDIPAPAIDEAPAVLETPAQPEAQAPVAAEVKPAAPEVRSPRENAAAAVADALAKQAARNRVDTSTGELFAE